MTSRGIAFLFVFAVFSIAPLAALAQGEQEAARTEAPRNAASSSDSQADDETTSAQPEPDNAEAELETIAVQAAEEKAPETEAATELEGIVVTATKRAKSEREIPATVKALAGEDLERWGAQGIDDYLKLVPGVSIGDDGVNPERVTIRGISADIGVNMTTGVLIDDVPFSDPFFPRVALDANPFDLETVEVLKGPQGTLFGGSGLNGAIRYVPEKPVFRQSQLKYFVQYKDFREQGGAGPIYGAALNAPLESADLAIRLMGFKRRTPGFVDDLNAGTQDVNFTDQHGGRLIAAWEPADRWKVSLMHMRQDTYIADQSYSDDPNGQLSRANGEQPSSFNTDFDLTSLQVGYGLDWADVVGIVSRTDKNFLAFLDFSRLTGGASKVAGAIENHSQGTTYELRLASPQERDGTWTWLVGAFATEVTMFDCVDTLAGQPLPSPTGDPEPCPAFQDRADDTYNAGHYYGDVSATERALFGEVGWEFLERFEVTGGARIYRTNIGGTTYPSGALYGDTSNQTSELPDKGVNPKLALSYRASRDILAYAAASRGYRFGGLNLADPPTFKSDTLWNYEVGTRTQWLDNALLADLTLYRIDWQDAQLVQFNGVPPSFNTNVGGAKGEGVELAILYRVPFIPGLTLNAAVASAKTVTTEPFTTVNGGNVPPGSDWPMAPKLQTSSAIAYQLMLGSWSIAPTVRHTYSSKAFNNLDHQVEVFGYGSFDGGITLGNTEHGGWPALIVTAENLTDERGLSGAAGTAGVYTDYLYIPPRSFGVRLEGRF